MEFNIDFEHFFVFFENCKSFNLMRIEMIMNVVCMLLDDEYRREQGWNCYFIDSGTVNKNIFNQIKLYSYNYEIICPT